MAHDPLKIKGYRTLSNEEIGMINSIKTHGDGLQMQVDALYDMDSIDVKWLATGEEYLKLGLMCLCRAVATPEGF